MKRAEPQAVTNRIEWIDRARGLGMLAVVFAHVVVSPVSETFYWFHMPLFFMLSGYVFKAKGRTVAYAKQRAEQLLVPYAAWTLIFTSLVAAKSARGTGKLLELATDAILGGAWLQGMMGVFWFVTCLYVALVAYHALQGFRWLSWLALGMYGLALLRGLYLPMAFPWAVDAALVAIPCIHVGAMAKAKRWTSYEAWMAVLGTAFLVAATAHMAGYPLPAVDIKNAKYGVPGLGAILAVAGSALVVLVAQRVPLKAFAYIGQASILVMFTHQAINILLVNRPDAIQFVAALGIPLALYPIAMKFEFTRRFLLGIAPKRSSDTKPPTTPVSPGSQIQDTILV